MARGLLFVVVVITPVISTAQSLDGVEIQQEDNELRKKKERVRTRWSFPVNEAWFNFFLSEIGVSCRDCCFWLGD